MPFTIAHAAAVLPLRKTRLPLAAMMIGSMSPDFSYFTPVTIALPTHTLGGLFWFCLPVGLAVWLFYVRVLEAPTIALLPDGWRGRVVRSEYRLSASLLMRVSLAILVGAATHLLWDSFTHSQSPVAEALPTLRDVTVGVLGKQLSVYRFLQYLSSIVGLVALAIWAWRQGPAPARPPQDPGSRLSNKLRLVSAVVLLASTCAAALTYVAQVNGPFGRQLFFLLIGGMTGWALGWSAVALFVSRKLRTT
jgi:uncharacterized protein DUF4184